MSKIKTIIIVTNQGVSTRSVGDVINGMLVDRIVDQSIEFESSIDFVYDGYTVEDKLIFQLINLPVEILYDN